MALHVTQLQWRFPAEMLHILKTRAMFAWFDKHVWWSQGKRLVAVAAAKRHMVVMSSDGDIYTWGHRVVTPRRVQLAGETLQVVFFVW